MFYYDLHVPLPQGREFQITAKIKRIRTNAQRYRLKAITGNTLLHPDRVYWGQAVAYNAQNAMAEILYETMCRRLHGRVEVKHQHATHTSTKG